MKVTFLLVPIALACCLIGCESESDPGGGNNTTDTSKVMPLKVGNAWTYEEEYYAEDGELIFADTFTFSLTKESVINGETYFRIDTSDSYYLNRANGLWYFRSGEFIYYAKYPCAVGDVFGVDTIIYGHLDDTGATQWIDTAIAVGRVDAKDVVLSVKGNLYTCIRYVWDYKLKNTSTLFARLVEHYTLNTGLVNDEVTYFDENTKKWYFHRAVRNLLKAELK